MEATSQPLPTSALPPIPAKRYFAIGEVAELCAVKPHVLRYWEQEFTQLRPVKRSGNRRYYQRHEVLLVRRIRSLLYDQGFTINGARNQLVDAGVARGDELHADEGTALPAALAATPGAADASQSFAQASAAAGGDAQWLRRELQAIRALLGP